MMSLFLQWPLFSGDLTVSILNLGFKVNNKTEIIHVTNETTGNTNRQNNNMWVLGKEKLKMLKKWRPCVE